MDDQLKHAVPRTLDALPKIFLWDFDIVLVFICITGLGILSDWMITSIIVGIVTASAYQKMKSGRQRGYSIHLLYWHMPISVGTRRTPPSSARNFTG